MRARLVRQRSTSREHPPMRQYGVLPDCRAPSITATLTVPPSCEVCGVKMRPNGELPSDHYADRRRETPELRRKPHLAVHRPSACSGVKALRNTSDAKRQSRQALLAFRSIDPFRALREPDRRRRDEERPFRSEQRTVSETQTTITDQLPSHGGKSPLTGKAPYKSGANLIFGDESRQ